MDVKRSAPGLLLLSTILYGSQAHKAADARYIPLWLYEGVWNVSRKTTDSNPKPDRIVNRCALLDKYFTCAQNINGSTGSLLIFIPAEKPGNYYTQTITPEGRATGRADLEISGDRWIFSNRWPQGNGKIVYYRTTNVFSGKNRIHFEQFESADGANWKLTGSGDEVRVPLSK